MALALHFLSCPNVGPRLLSDHGRKKNKFERFPRSRPKLGSQARFSQVPRKRFPSQVPKGSQEVVVVACRSVGAYRNPIQRLPKVPKGSQAQVPKQCSQQEVRKNPIKRFSKVLRQGSQAMFPTFPKRGSQARFSGRFQATVSRIGYQVRLPRTGFQARLPRTGL